MNLKSKYLLCSLVFIFLPFISCDTAAQDNTSPNNVILLIGDGMSYPQISAARYAQGELHITSMPYLGSISTYASDNKVTDSASGATALAAGYKTNNRMLGVLPDGSSVQSIAHYANELGKSTALIASSRITHATPAAFAIHHADRGDEFIIAEKFVDSGIDMLMGAGSDYFLPESMGGNRPDNRNLIAEMQEQGYVYVDQEDELSQLSGQEKVIAFLEGGDLEPAPARGDQMTQLTRVALEQLSENPNGFFLMIEGSQIDWAGHNNDAEGMIQEMIDFDNVIGQVLEFAEADGNTLVVVTADHETGGLTLTSGSDGEFSYEFSTRGHTAVDVPVYSYGPSGNLFLGTYDNTEVGRKLFEIWGRDF